jgi:subtilisin family serine protease
VTSVVFRLSSACLLVAALQVHAQQPTAGNRHDAAAAAFARGLMPLHSSRVDRFAADHPEWDGRGVLIAILDSGIDPGVAGLTTTTDGAPKIIDLRDFSHEGRVALRQIARHGDTLIIGNHRLRGASRVAALSGDLPLWGGVLVETTLGKAPAADLNGNGKLGDTLLVVVGKTPSGWALFADTDGSGSLAEERPVHDFAVAHEFFGWHQAAAPPVDIAVNLADSAGVPVLDLFFDTSSHGTHVAGIAAGHDLYGVAGFDGVAPGARLIGLKIADDAHGAVSTTGSMLHALDYAIRFARDRALPLVVNLSFGVGNEIEGTARIDRLIDSVLAAHPDVVMTVAAGNDGPGLSTIGFPASASRVIAVGATLPSVFAGGNTADTTSDLIAPFSSRGGELAGPDIVVPGAAYSSVPNFAAGQELENGTSMASPYAAGLVARLTSALVATKRRASARMLRQALRMGARQLPSGSIVDQGAGLPDLGAAWNWLAVAHDLPAVVVEAGGISGRAGILLNSGAGSTGARIVLRDLEGSGARTLRLRADSAWLQIPETVAMTNGSGEFTARIVAPALAASGATSSAIRVEGPDETAGPVAVIPVLIRTPVPDAGTRTPIAVEQPSGTTRRLFVHADSGRGLQIEVATLRASDQVNAALHEPGGMPFRDGGTIVAGFGDGAGLFDIGGSDVVGGQYEVDVMAGPHAPISARVSVHPAPLRLGAVLVRDTLHVTARSLVTAPLSVRLRAGLLGAERHFSVRATGDSPVRLVVPVPSWAAHLSVDTRMARDAWSRFTDLGLSFLDRRGREFESTPINYAFSRATPDLPDSTVGDSIVVLLSPGFADPDDHAPWALDVDIRFYVATPYSLDAGGSPYRPVLAGALREERFVPGTLPIALPPEFVPVITVVALEGKDQTWTRELVVTRPASAP